MLFAWDYIFWHIKNPPLGIYAPFCASAQLLHGPKYVWRGGVNVKNTDATVKRKFGANLWSHEGKKFLYKSCHIFQGLEHE